MTGNTDAITEDIIADYEEDSEDVAVIDEDEDTAEDTEEDTEDSSTKIDVNESKPPLSISLKIRYSPQTLKNISSASQNIT